jgi:hypothetical protein
MAYRIRYVAYIDWVTPGMGLGMTAGPAGPGAVPAGNAQTIAFFNSDGVVNGTTYPPNTSTFQSADVTTLTNAMAADLAAQMDAPAVLTRVQNFSTGGG